MIAGDYIEIIDLNDAKDFFKQNSLHNTYLVINQVDEVR